VAWLEYKHRRIDMKTTLMMDEDALLDLMDHVAREATGELDPDNEECLSEALAARLLGLDQEG